MPAQLLKPLQQTSGSTTALSSPRTASPSPQSPATKQNLDRVLAIVLLIPALPVIAVLWSLVRLTSRGPGLYSQRRSGLHGQNFNILKLRTMTHNCERTTGAVWAIPQDPRVTPLGRFLRATHLDELPQLFNVLRGEMSLVGPRPERPEIIERLLPEIPEYLERLQVRPGVTGLAQIFARPDLTVEDVRLKLRYDLRYIRAMSAWLDLRLMACTALKMCGLNRRPVRALLLPEFVRKSKSRVEPVYNGITTSQPRNSPRY